jgi:hypothetical protein
MIRVVVLGGAMAGLLFTGAAQAQTAAYNWTGYGVNVAGSSKCPTYKMTIDLTVEGNTIKGQFQQEGRPQRQFQATKDGGSLFKAKAEVGGNNFMDVTGSLKDGDLKVMLDGYCKFGGPLTKK